MILEVIFKYEIDPSTGEMKLLSKKEVTVDTTVETKKVTKKSSSKIDDNPEPLVTLDSNKLILTKGAYDLLKVCDDCRVDIKYKKKDKKAIPVIGTDSSFNTKGGNKVTSKLSVSFRGAANEKLSEYGTIFKLEPTDSEGIYYMIGDKEQDEVKIPEELINIEEELNIDTLDELNIDEDDTNLEKFDFKL